jgi:hypothetical protein
MSPVKTTLHNAKVLSAVTREVVTGEEALTNPGDTFIFGLVIGVLLHQTAPLTAEELRREVEAIVARDKTPEQVEVYLRDVVGLFDTSADR